MALFFSRFKPECTLAKFWQNRRIVTFHFAPTFFYTAKQSPQNFRSAFHHYTNKTLTSPGIFSALAVYFRVHSVIWQNGFYFDSPYPSIGIVKHAGLAWAKGFIAHSSMRLPHSIRLSALFSIVIAMLITIFMSASICPASR